MEPRLNHGYFRHWWRYRYIALTAFVCLFVKREG